MISAYTNMEISYAWPRVDSPHSLDTTDSRSVLSLARLFIYIDKNMKKFLPQN